VDFVKSHFPGEDILPLACVVSLQASAKYCHDRMCPRLRLTGCGASCACRRRVGGLSFVLIA
jgi:hypothetical protein